MTYCFRDGPGDGGDARAAVGAGAHGEFPELGDHPAAAGAGESERGEVPAAAHRPGDAGDTGRGARGRPDPGEHEEAAAGAGQSMKFLLSTLRPGASMGLDERRWSVDEHR